MKLVAAAGVSKVRVAAVEPPNQESKAQPTPLRDHRRGSDTACCPTTEVIVAGVAAAMPSTRSGSPTGRVLMANELRRGSTSRVTTDVAPRLSRTVRRTR